MEEEGYLTVNRQLFLKLRLINPLKRLYLHQWHETQPFLLVLRGGRTSTSVQVRHLKIKTRGCDTWCHDTFSTISPHKCRLAVRCSGSSRSGQTWLTSTAGAPDRAAGGGGVEEGWRGGLTHVMCRVRRVDELRSPHRRSRRRRRRRRRRRSVFKLRGHMVGCISSEPGYVTWASGAGIVLTSWTCTCMTACNTHVNMQTQMKASGGVVEGDLARMHPKSKKRSLSSTVTNMNFESSRRCSSPSDLISRLQL